MQVYFQRSYLKRSDNLFVLILVAEPLNDEGGEETGLLVEQPLTTCYRKCYILKPKSSNPNLDSNQHFRTGGRLGKHSYLP